MCSISGFILTSPCKNVHALAQAYGQVLTLGQNRGHDSTGVVAVQSNGNIKRRVNLGVPNLSLLLDVIDSSTRILIGNNRAEPTTEFIAQKSEKDIQPFGDGITFVSHNGIIANDQELADEYNIERQTRIDTAVIPGLISLLGIQPAVEKLSGSYALAIVDKRDPGRLWLARNFKPLYLQSRPEHGVIFFASRPEHLRRDNSLAGSLLEPAIVEVPPYSLVEINASTGLIRSESLVERASNKRALVICSGGLDSTTAARWTQLQGFEITLLHFQYGCRAETREMQAVKEIAQALDCDYRFEDLSWLGKLGGSSLTDTSLNITRNEVGAEFPHEWVPARNLIFTALSAGLCDRYGYDTLVLGLNLEEGGAYPDNTTEFYELLDKVCDIGTLSRPRILSPLAEKVKHEIVSMALEINAPIQHSWSCYHGNEHHCGQCGPCYMRRNAFRMLGLTDPIHYMVQSDAS
jgi:7-cyano-7-deazaguanine synthase